MCLELHWEPNGIPQGTPGLKALFQEALGHAEAACVQGHSFPVFPPHGQWRRLLLHARKHLAVGGLGFRQVIDWMLFVKAYLAHDGWTEFSELLGDERVERTATCLTRFCQIYLGLPEEGFEWCAEVEPTVCADLLEHVMLLGNFGKKIKGKTGATALSGIRGPVGFFRYLQRGGVCNWESRAQACIAASFRLGVPSGAVRRVILTRQGHRG